MHTYIRTRCKSTHLQEGGSRLLILMLPSLLLTIVGSIVAGNPTGTSTSITATGASR